MPDDAAGSAAADPGGDLTLGLLSIGEATVAIEVGYLAEVAHIETLQKRLGNGGDGALGVIAIRGALLPVIDPLGIYASAGTSPEIAAVLSDDTAVTGLAVDGVKGLRRFPARSLQRLTGDGGDSLNAGTIYDGGRQINVLNARAVLDRPDYPKASLNLRKALASDRGLARPYLTFEAGGVAFAVRAETVFGTVPRQGIEDATMSDDRFLGTIRYFRRRVPVMATNRVFGLGRGGATDRFETVVLRFPGDRLLGLAVDRIVHVANPSEAQSRPLPVTVTGAMSLLAATAPINEVAHFLIDEARIVADPELVAAAELSETRADEPDPPAAAGAGSGKVVRERERYLLFQAGTRIAVRMTQIDGMREPPAAGAITRPDADLPGLAGLFFQDGALIPLIRLSEHLGLDGAPDPARARVILTRSGDVRIGFLVDAVDGIATSSWFTPQDEAVSADFDLVSLRAQGREEVRNALDLGRVSEAVAARFGAG
ncbi:hypothetical protein HKCCE3408_06245 [Rhodobacterales bacterium HKCCE3408]|nr:hypothetical protein [Rhodobacterales bacterium HKCCE3408]